MKTILEISREIGVSKQTVYKRFKGKLYTEVQPYVYTKNGTTYILEQGESIIKSDFLRDSSISDVEHTERIRDTHTDILIQTLQKEIEVKNRQIEELAATIRIQAESIRAANNNELAETIIDGRAQTEIATEKKRGFFSRIFSKE